MTSGLQPGGPSNAQSPQINQVEGGGVEPQACESSIRFRNGGRPNGELHLPAVSKQRKPVGTIHRPCGPTRLAIGAAATPRFSILVFPFLRSSCGNRTGEDRIFSAPFLPSGRRAEIEEQMDAEARVGKIELPQPGLESGALPTENGCLKLKSCVGRTRTRNRLLNRELHDLCATTHSPHPPPRLG